MGKVSSKEKSWRRRQLRSSGNRYLRPGTLAQLRCNKPSGSGWGGGGGGKSSCTDIGKKRVAVLHSKKSSEGHEEDDKKVFDKSPLMLSPVNLVKPTGLIGTPKTPRIEECQSESRLESLPMDLLVEIKVLNCGRDYGSGFGDSKTLILRTNMADAAAIAVVIQFQRLQKSCCCGRNCCCRPQFKTLVKILCHLHHDQLRAVFHVSQRIRKAVVIARQFHFNYTTPDRSRQEMLSTTTPRPYEHWPFLCKGVRIPSPHTPKAPRHGPRPPSRLKVSEMRQVTAVLFQESAFPSRCLVPSVIPKPLCKSLASNRVLFYEDELCQAVAQNKLR